MASPNLAIFDVETTNHGGKVQISEFAALVLDATGLYQVESYSTFLRTSANPSAPTFAQVADKITEILAGKVWLGFNLKQSVDQLTTSFRDAKRKVPSAQQTLDLSSLPALTKSFPSGVPNLANHFGLGQPRHRALEDCRMMLDIFKGCALSIFLKIHVADFRPDFVVETIPVDLVLPPPSPKHKQEVKAAPAPAPTPTPAPTPVAKPAPAKKTAPPKKSAWAALPPTSPPQAPKPALVEPTPVSMPAAAVSKPVPKAVAKPAPAASIKEIQASTAAAKINAYPLNTAWADKIAPNRVKTELSYEPTAEERAQKKRNADNKQNAKKRSDGQKQQGGRPRKDGKDGKDGKNQDKKSRPSQPRPPKNAERQPRRKSKSSVGSSDEPQQTSDGWNAVAAPRKPRPQGRPPQAQTQNRRNGERQRKPQATE